MSYDHGPLRTYEITWKSGHIETVQGHQVLFGSDKMRLDIGYGFGATQTAESDPRFTIHGEFGGQWRLVLTALESELVSVRDVTDREQMPEGQS